MTYESEGRNSSDVPRSYVEALTRSAKKSLLYRDDPYFRHGFRQCDVDTALSHTFVVLKPDAIAGRRVDATVDFLAAHDFEPVASQRFRFTPLLTREVWRYQFNIASAARIEVVDLLLPAADSWLLLLRDKRYQDGDLPAACRLASAKGAADPGARTGPSLRTLLKSPTTLFNFVHTADEPADVVRELGLLEIASGQAVVGAASSAAARREELRGLYSDCPAHDLDAAASRKRLANANVGGSTFEVESASWTQVLDCFANRRPPPEFLWDALSIATSEIDSNVEGLDPVLHTMGAAVWRPEKAGYR